MRCLCHSIPRFTLDSDGRRLQCSLNNASANRKAPKPVSLGYFENLDLLGDAAQ